MDLILYLNWCIIGEDNVTGGKSKMTGKSNCDCCLNYAYDDDYECYVCEVNLDEDEMGQFMRNTFTNCPYFQFNDEYKVVRKQM